MYGKIDSDYVSNWNSRVKGESIFPKSISHLQNYLSSVWKRANNRRRTVPKSILQEIELKLRASSCSLEFEDAVPANIEWDLGEYQGMINLS